MKPHIFRAVTIIRRPIDEMFDFFSNAENLSLITPPEFRFKILNPLPIVMREGTLIDYKIKISGVAVKWRTEITMWEPPHCFEDKQLKGPYKVWLHRHSFREISNGTTEMTDSVNYLAPGWLLEPLIHYLYVKRKVETLFHFREKKLQQLFS